MDGKHQRYHPIGLVCAALLSIEIYSETISFCSSLNNAPLLYGIKDGSGCGVFRNLPQSESY